jgi:hypothetical protein
MGENLAALRRGEIDVMQAFEPDVSIALKDRIADMLYAVASRGPTVYTTFIATREGIARHRADETVTLADLLCVALMGGSGEQEHSAGRGKGKCPEQVKVQPSPSQEVQCDPFVDEQGNNRCCCRHRQV